MSCSIIYLKSDIQFCKHFVCWSVDHRIRRNSVFALFFCFLQCAFLYSSEMEATRRLAEQGDREAQFKLAELYADGEEIKRDLSESMKWLQKSAKQGFPEAQLTLGFCYEHGKGIEQDEVEAVKWYRKAAEQGHPRAQYALGLSYETGIGVEINETEAEKWYRKAAEQEYPRAKEALNELNKYDSEFKWLFLGFIIIWLLVEPISVYIEIKKMNPMLRRKMLIFRFISSIFFISIMLFLLYSIRIHATYLVCAIIFLSITCGISVYYLEKKILNKYKKD